MKQILIFLILLAAYYLARSQNQITRCEYWVDNNYSARISPAVTPSATCNFTSAIDYSGLSSGVHVFNIRFRQTDGKWSSVLNKMFVKPPPGTIADNNISRYEYWIDNAYTSRISQAVTPTGNYSFLSGINLNSLSEGTHAFNIRFRQSDGKWGSVLSQMFVKWPVNAGGDYNITRYEYWLDNAYAAKVSQAVTPSSTFSFVSGINCGSLSTGAHIFNIRFRQSNGSWSSTLSQMFCKSPPANGGDNSITTYEYWMDNAFSARVAQAVTPVSGYSFISGINCSSLSVGVHVFNIRFRQTDGSWSSVLSKMFVKPPPMTISPGTISRYEYWFNDGYAGRAIVNTPAQQIWTTDDILAIDTMSYLINTFHSRYRDNYGNWTYVDQQFYSLGLDISLFLQGLYENGPGAMRKAQNESGDNFTGTIADTVTIEIRESLSPYHALLVYHGVELNTDGCCHVEGVGTSMLNIPLANNSLYHIVVKHRNSIETWSRATQLSAQASFNFTNAASKAYGNNLILSGGKYLIYGGDVNQDGLVDSGDMIPVDNQSFIFGTGYMSCDTNGDGLIDSGDMIIVDNNAFNFVTSITP